KTRKQALRQTSPKFDLQRGPLALELEEMLDQGWVGVENLGDLVGSENGLADQKLERHVLIVALQRSALRALEDEVGGHQPGCDRPAGQVVHRLGPMAHRVDYAQDVDDDVG